MSCNVSELHKASIVIYVKNKSLYHQQEVNHILRMESPMYDQSNHPNRTPIWSYLAIHTAALEGLFRKWS